jgi:hypothetical protein
MKSLIIGCFLLTLINGVYAQHGTHASQYKTLVENLEVAACTLIIKSPIYQPRGSWAYLGFNLGQGWRENISSNLKFYVEDPISNDGPIKIWNKGYSIRIHSYWQNIISLVDDENFPFKRFRIFDQNSNTINIHQKTLKEIRELIQPHANIWCRRSIDIQN